MIEGVCLGVDAERTNVYALVFYATGPLALFLDELRAELEPLHPAPRSHVTVLPPRPIPDHPDPAPAIAQLHHQVSEFTPFQVVLGGVDSFAGTNVVYLSVAHGYHNLERMHQRLNQEALQYKEPFLYHPHITLAQGLDPERLPKVLELARKRWAEYNGPRFFQCDSWFFVQSTTDLRWIDLAGIDLAPAPVPEPTGSRK